MELTCFSLFGPNLFIASPASSGAHVFQSQLSMPLITVGAQASPWASWTPLSSSIKEHAGFSISMFPLTIKVHSAIQGTPLREFLEDSVHIGGIRKQKVTAGMLGQSRREYSKCLVTKNCPKHILCPFSFTSETPLNDDPKLWVSPGQVREDQVGPLFLFGGLWEKSTCSWERLSDLHLTLFCFCFLRNLPVAPGECRSTS